MILNLSDRPDPLAASRSRAAARLLLSFCLVASATALGLYGSTQLPPSPPPPPLAQPVEPVEPYVGPLTSPGSVERFRARETTAVHREPAGASAVVARLQTGEVATVLRHRGPWLLVETEAGPGWIDTSRRWSPPVHTSYRVERSRTLGSTASGSALDAPDAPHGISPAGPPASPLEPQAGPPQAGSPHEPLSSTERRARQIEEYRAESPAVAWARERLSRQGLRMLESEHFRLWTDLDDASRLGLLLGLAEQTRRRFRDLLEPHFVLDELAGRSEIFVFRRRRDYLEFFRRFSTAEASGASEPTGHYSMDLRTIALAEETLVGNSVAATLVHEMTHLLLDQSLYGGATLARPWLGEGLACVLAYTTGSDEGRIASVQSRSDRFGVGRTARARLGSVQADLHGAGLPLPLERVLSAQQTDFTGTHGGRYYDSAWLLCHFLLYADEGRHRSLLAGAIAADRGGEDLEPFVREIRSLEPAWRRWVLGLARR